MRKALSAALLIGLAVFSPSRQNTPSTLASISAPRNALGTPAAAQEKANPSGNSSIPLAPVLVISGGTLISGTGAPPVKDSVLVIRGDRITAVGRRGLVQVPSNVDRRIDASGKWVIPGLIDAHVHFSQSGGLYTRPDVIDLRSRVPYERERAQIKERLPHTFAGYLCSGVTSVVDMGGPTWNFQVREMAAHMPEAPRVAVAGPLISTYAPPELDNHDPDIIKANTPEEARALVRREVEHSPDLVKIWYILTPDAGIRGSLPMVKAAVEESHAHGVRVAVHATELETARAAIAAGADILVHSVEDSLVPDEFITALKKRQIIYTPTLVVEEGYKKVLARQAVLSDIDRVCGDPQAAASWNDLKTMPKDGIFQQAGELDASIPTMKTNLKKVISAGVIVAAGTDAGNIGTLHGSSLHREFELMSQAGLTSMQILLSATRDAARVFSRTPQMGTLEPGKFADIVILDADPLADIRNASKIHTVIKGGVVFAEADLARDSRTR